MRTLIGWISALFASALIGAAMYEAVLSDPVPQAAADKVVERMVADQGDRPTIVRTEVREVVEPTPTITVEEVVVVAPAQPATSQRATSPDTSGTAAPTSPRLGEDDSDDRDDDGDDASEDEDDDDSDDGSDDPEGEDD